MNSKTAILAVLALLALAWALPARAADVGLFDASRFSYSVGGGIAVYGVPEDQVGPWKATDAEAAAALGWASGEHGTLVVQTRYGFANEWAQQRVAYSIMLNEPVANQGIGVAAFACYTWYGLNKEPGMRYDPPREPGVGLSLSIPLGLGQVAFGGSVSYGVESQATEARAELRLVGGFTGGN